MTTTRMNDTEYAQAFVELENATELNAVVLAKLTQVGNERFARVLESQMGHRSQRGKSSSQNRKFIQLVNGLNDRFSVRLHYKSCLSNIAAGRFEVRPAGSWR